MCAFRRPPKDFYFFPGFDICAGLFLLFLTPSELSAEFSECIHSLVEFLSISNKDPYVWLAIPLRFRQPVLGVIELVDDLKIRVIPVEAHLVNRIVLPASIVELRRQENDVLRRYLAIGVVRHVLLVECLAPLPVLEEEAVHVLVQVSRLYSTDNLFRLLEARVLAVLDPLHDQVRPVPVRFRII